LYNKPPLEISPSRASTQEVFASKVMHTEVLTSFIRTFCSMPEAHFFPHTPCVGFRFYLYLTLLLYRIISPPSSLCLRSGSIPSPLLKRPVPYGPRVPSLPFESITFFFLSPPPASSPAEVFRNKKLKAPVRLLRSPHRPRKPPSTFSPPPATFSGFAMDRFFDVSWRKMPFPFPPPLRRVPLSVFVRPFPPPRATNLALLFFFPC